MSKFDITAKYKFRKNKITQKTKEVTKNMTRETKVQIILYATNKKMKS